MNIAIYCPTGIGNYILKTPFLHTLQKTYPKSNLFLLVEDGFLLKNNLVNDEFFNFKLIFFNQKSKLSKIKLIFSLKRLSINYLIFPFDAYSSLSVFCSLLMFIPFRVVHYHPEKISLTQKVLFFFSGIHLLPATKWVPTIGHRHEIDLNYDLLQAIHPAYFKRTYTTRLYLQPSPSTLSSLFGLRPKTYIIIQPAAANGSYTAKMWNPQSTLELLKKISEENIFTVLVGDAGDANLLQPYLKDLPENTLNLVGKTNFNELLNIIYYSNLVICHDSGVMHIADALAVPLIALYGPTDYHRTRPLKNTSKVLISSTDFTMAMFNFQKTEADLEIHNKNFKMMGGISVEDVFCEVKNILT